MFIFVRNLKTNVLNTVLRLLLLFALTLPFQVSAQRNRTEQQTQYSLRITRTESPITVDGNLDEAAWSKAAEASNFCMKWPRDGGPAPQETTVRCLYDDPTQALLCQKITKKQWIGRQRQMLEWMLKLV